MQEISMKQVAEPTCYMLCVAFFLGFFFQPEDRANMFSWNVTQQTTCYYIPEDNTPHNQCCDKLQSYAFTQEGASCGTAACVAELQVPSEIADKYSPYYFHIKYFQHENNYGRNEIVNCIIYILKERTQVRTVTLMQLKHINQTANTCTITEKTQVPYPFLHAYLCSRNIIKETEFHLYSWQDKPSSFKHILNGADVSA